MDKKWAYNIIRKLKLELFKHESINLNSYKTESTLINQKQILKISSERQDFIGLLNLYNYYNEFSLDWNAKSNDLEGKINVLPLNEVFINYENFVYFNHTPEDSPLRNFKIIDFFVDEACVGIYTERDDLPGMHYFEFENEAYPLHVDFEGYLRLLGMTRGYLYWQKVILDYLYDRETPITNEFKENMPTLFEDFNWEDFIKLYEEVRIDK